MMPANACKFSYFLAKMDIFDSFLMEMLSAEVMLRATRANYP